MTTAAPSIVADLRAATASAHAAVERHFAGLMNPAPEVLLYDAFLLAMRRFHATFEPLLDAAAARYPQKLRLARGPRQKLSLLDEDLRDRRLEVPNVHSSTAPTTLTVAEALGVTYVVEGSTLGHRVLHRHLAPRLALTTHAYRFLGAYGERTGVMWRAVAETLETFGRNEPEGRETTIEAARRCFRWLEADMNICANVKLPPPVPSALRSLRRP